MTTIEPIYVREADLVMSRGKSIPLDLCQICALLVPGQVIGTQLQNEIWSIWLRSDQARSHLLDSVKTLDIDNHNVELLGTYPTSKCAPDEKIILKDIPIGMSNADVLDFLRGQPGIIVKSPVIPARIRDHNQKLTQFLSGDRFVYVKGHFAPVLHSTGIIKQSKCRIYHNSQKYACARCRMLSHETRDIDKCPAYSHDTDVIIIKSPSFSLCNYYLCPVKVFNMEFMSSEHAYQWRFLTYLDMPDLAQEVLNTSTAGEAKAVASRVPGHLHRDWHKIKSCVMKEILHAKADSCPKFRDTLLNSAGKRLIEAVRGDIFWSSGLSPLFASSTKPQYFPGSNQLGYVLESVRHDLMKEAVLSRQFDIDDCIDISDFPSESQPRSNALELIENTFEVPLPASSLPLPTTTHSEGIATASLCINADVLPDVSPPSPFQSPPASPSSTCQRITLRFNCE